MKGSYSHTQKIQKFRRFAPKNRGVNLRLTPPRKPRFYEIFLGPEIFEITEIYEIHREPRYTLVTGATCGTREEEIRLHNGAREVFTVTKLFAQSGWLTVLMKMGKL